MSLKLKIKVNHASKSAIEKVQKAGGTVEILIKPKLTVKKSAETETAQSE